MKRLLDISISLTFNLFVVASIVWGLANRDRNLVSAETGLGYLLGIVGGTLMVLLLLYPLRKRIRLFNRFGSVKFLFKTHMLFGVVGPVLILFHSNFQIGSLNSSIAMACMLIVASSGLIGRYLYTKIHHGLYGSHIEIRELQANTQAVEDKLSGEFREGGLNVAGLKDDAMQKQRHEYAELVFKRSTGIISSISTFIKIQIQTRLKSRAEIEVIEEKMNVNLKVGDISQQDYDFHLSAIKSHLSDYYSAIRKSSTYMVSEKLFALWHVLHIPIFVMMLISAIVHIVVVHMY